LWLTSLAIENPRIDFRENDQCKGRAAQFHKPVQTLGIAVDTGVIFVAEQTKQLADANKIDDVSPPFWTPTADQISVLESKLKSYLEAQTSPEAQKILGSLE